MLKNNNAFTLVELVVSMTILAIFSVMGTMYYTDAIADARDSQRINDIEKLWIDLKSHKQKEWAYPLPINPINITNSGVVIFQGLMTSDIISNVLSNIPKDPRSKNWYWYSTPINRQQFQLALTLENIDTPKAVVKGDYKSVAKNLFPTLFLAVTGATSFDVNVNSGKFILDGGSYNLPYDMKWQLISLWSTLSGILSENEVIVETGWNYLSCLEVYNAGRSMGSGTYQIVNSGSALIEDIDCPMNY